MEKKLLAGAARVCITPPVNMMPAESFLPIQLEGVYQDIFVRSLVLENEERRFAFIVIESGDLGRSLELKKALREKYDFADEDLCFTVTHTHEAPSFANEHQDIIKNSEKLKWVTAYGDFVITQVVECVGKAIEELQPVKWGYASGECYINVCRDQRFEDGKWGIGYDYTGPSDKQLFVMKFVNEAGNMVAVWMNYAVHGTACFFGQDEAGEKHLISGDLPGMTSSYIEKRYEEEGTIVLWTSGAAGDQAPVLFPTYEKMKHDKTHEAAYGTGYACWGLCRHLAETQGVDAIRLIEGIDRLKDFMKISVVDRILKVPGKICRKNPEGAPVNLVLKLVTLNDVAVFGIGGELVSSIGKRLKERSPLKNTIILTHIAERIDYIPDRSGYERRTFEGENTRLRDGCGEEYITTAMVEMFDKRHQ